MFRLRHPAAWSGLALWVGAAMALAPAAARACSICRCGDATFAALGADVFSSPHTSFALDYERFRKQSIHAEPLAGVTHSLGLVEDRWTLSGLYGRGGRWSVLVRLPFSARRLDVQEALVAKAAPHVHVTPGRYGANALSDPELSLYWQAWRSRFEPQFGHRTFVALQGGVKLPWGRNDLQLNGVRLSEHLQAGTGSTDGFAGASVLHLLNERSTFFASASVRMNGANGVDYHYGSAALANVAYERKLNTRFDSVVELNYRFARQDEITAGAADPDTGGHVLYASPRVLFSLGSGWVARAAAQIPVATRLAGRQTEQAVLNAGLNYLH